MRIFPLLLITAACLFLPSAAGAFPGTAASDIASINALRSQNGIPAAIVENPAWSANCALHVQYMRKTLTVTHAEDPASPWFTEGGNWAGTNSVLSFGNVWAPNLFIWETAPFHLAQILAPELAQVGIADDDEYVCLTTWPGYTRPLPQATSVVTYPGNGTSIYASEATFEWPQTPAQALGLANPTGPHLYVFEWGGILQSLSGSDGYTTGITAASVVGPNGPVAVRWVDRNTPSVGAYLPAASGIIIPERPVVANTAYLASVQFSNGISHVWTFTTTEGIVPYSFSHVRVTARRTGVRRVCARRTSSGCARWVSAYRQRLTVRGRLVNIQTGAGYPGVAVTIKYRNIERAITLSSASGAFTQSYIVVSRRRSFDLPVTVRANTNITASYTAQFR